MLKKGDYGVIGSGTSKKQIPDGWRVLGVVGYFKDLEKYGGTSREGIGGDGIIID